MLSILIFFLGIWISLIFFFLCRLRSLREIHFWAKLHQINRAHFYQEQLVVSIKTFAETQLFFPSSELLLRTFSVLFIFLPWSLFSVYRAVNTTNSDRGSCCGCKVWIRGCRAVCRSSCNFWLMDWKPSHVQRNDAAAFYRHTAGTWTLEHHRRCRVINTRLFIIFFFSPLQLYNTVEFGFMRGQNHSRSTRAVYSEPDRNLSSKCFRKWISRSWESKNWLYHSRCCQ